MVGYQGLLGSMTKNTAANAAATADAVETSSAESLGTVPDAAGPMAIPLAPAELVVMTFPPLPTFPDAFPATTAVADRSIVSIFRDPLAGNSILEAV